MRKSTFDLPMGSMVACAEDGPCPPVVCVHGAGVSSRELLPYVSAAAGVRQTWAVDLPGFGASTAAWCGSGPGSLAQALGAWCKHAGLGATYLLGCSFGCQVAVEAALRSPDQVRGLILVGLTVDPAARSLVRQAARWLRNSAHEPPDLGRMTVRDYRDAGLRRVWASFRESLGDRIEDKLPHVGVPALVVRGEFDALVPQAWAEEATRLLPSGRLVTWPGAAHMVPFADPAGLVARVEEFVTEVEV